MRRLFKISARDCWRHPGLHYIGVDGNILRFISLFSSEHHCRIVKYREKARNGYSFPCFTKDGVWMRADKFAYWSYTKSKYQGNLVQALKGFKLWRSNLWLEGSQNVSQ